MQEKGGITKLMLSSEIKSKAIQLLTTHSNEINCNLPSQSELLAYVLMIMTDKR